MDKRFRYREKHVHDIPVEDSFVRVWTVDGAVDRDMIARAFAPLIRAHLVYPFVALMPDYHPGEQAMIGSVIPTRTMLLPAVIGGDLGCGMATVRLPLQAEDLRPHLERIREHIAAAIPVGGSYNSTVTERVQRHPFWQQATRAPALTHRVRNKLVRQFGSLGAGNHFLELQEDTEQRVWATVHSGSRGLGVLIRDYYIERGAGQSDLDQKLYARIPHFLGESPLGTAYLTDLQYALDFAFHSRREMLLRILDVLVTYVPALRTLESEGLVQHTFDLTHNFVAREEHWGEPLYVHRKGATRASQGMLGIIPGSMGSRSYVVEGRGNEQSFCSCAHGAGRAMSRGAALRAISDKHFRNSMANVVYQHDDRLKDESPLAYKDIQRVMRGQKDLVKILHELTPVLSIKGIDRAADHDDDP